MSPWRLFFSEAFRLTTKNMQKPTNSKNSKKKRFSSKITNKKEIFLIKYRRTGLFWTNFILFLFCTKAVVIKLCAAALWCAVRKFEKCRENILKKWNNQVFPKIWLIFSYKSYFILFVYENMLVFHANFFKNFILQRI